MDGQQISQSTTLPNNLRLMVKPLNYWNLSKFKPHNIQKDCFESTKKIFKNGFPDHQGILYDGRKSILIFGLIDMGGGQYYCWTVFGENFKKFHLRFVINYTNRYLNMLQYKSIHHIIRKDMPWTKKMMSMAGFEYVRDEEEATEHWIKL